MQQEFPQQFLSQFTTLLEKKGLSIEQQKQVLTALEKAILTRFLYTISVAVTPEQQKKLEGLESPTIEAYMQFLQQHYSTEYLQEILAQSTDEMLSSFIEQL